MMMMAQVKKACRSTTKDIIYVSDGNIPTTYQEWKRRILRIDHNWRMRKAETGGGTKVTEWKQQAKMNTALSKGNQSQHSGVPEKKTGTGTTYGEQGALMDIDRTRAKAKCY